MEQETRGKIKYGVWGLIGGAVIAIIIGFAWGGWKTSGTAEIMTEKAVLASKAAICVAQFMKVPSYEEKLKEFEKISSWNISERTKFIHNGGWDKMPGQKKADDDVARACADGLEHLLTE